MDIIKVLYAEDEEDIRDVTEFALEDEGFELVSCASGQEALDKAPKTKADLILLDVMMPGMDGPTTLTQLKAYPHLQNVPAIFMTAKVRPEEVEKYLAIGAIGVISKPFDAMTLADEIRNLMENSV